MVGADIDFKRRAVRQNLEGDVRTEDLCRVYGISPRTLRGWARRYREEGAAGLEYRSRRPRRLSRQTPARTEDRILRMKRRHPAWGAKRIHATLARKGVAVHWTTVHRVLKRNGLMVRVSKKTKPWKRFQRHRVDSLWQMDVCEFRIAGVGRVYVVTILDDRSRYLVMAKAYRRKRAAEAVNALWWALRNGRRAQGRCTWTTGPASSRGTSRPSAPSRRSASSTGGFTPSCASGTSSETGTAARWAAPSSSGAARRTTCGNT